MEQRIVLATGAAFAGILVASLVSLGSGMAAAAALLPAFGSMFTPPITRAIRAGREVR
jgi:hypothetical protein